MRDDQPAAGAAMVLSANTRVHDRYQIIRLIGQGGMGAVYEAVDERLGSHVALKQITVSGVEVQRAFAREAKLLAHLRHPALPRVFDYFSDNDAQFLVMDVIEGTDLAARLAAHGGPLAVASVLGWADTLLDALDYLHHQPVPIIHRDIKPQNIALTSTGQVVLLDFGLAKGALDAQTVVGTASVFGYTPRYAPLEQIQGTGTEPRSDLYALGATLFHLLTNTEPINAVQRATALLGGQPDPQPAAHDRNPLVPPAVSTVLMHAMALRTDQRPPDAAAMRAALRAAQSQPAPRATAVLTNVPTVAPPLVPVAVPPRQPIPALAPEEIDEQSALLATHRHTLAIELQQQAELGAAYCPPGLLYSIAASRSNIQRIKAVLRAAGVTVDDDPDDDAPPPVPHLSPNNRRQLALIAAILVGTFLLTSVIFQGYGTILSANPTRALVATTSTAPPTLVPTSATDARPDLEYTFAGGTATGWTGDTAQWRVISDDTHFVYEGRAPSDAIAASAPPHTDELKGLRDYAVAFRVRVVQPSTSSDLPDAWLALRANNPLRNGCESYGFSINLRVERANIVRNGKDACAYTRLDVQPFSFQRNVWYDVRAEVAGTHERFTIDGVLVAETDDASLSSGFFYINVAPNAVVQFGDVRLYRLP